MNGPPTSVSTWPAAIVEAHGSLATDPEQRGYQQEQQEDLGKAEREALDMCPRGDILEKRQVPAHVVGVDVKGKGALQEHRCGQQDVEAADEACGARRGRDYLL